MKRILFYVGLAAISLAACHKQNNTPPVGSQNPPMGNSGLFGKWTIVTVTTYAYDSAGLRQNGTQVYPEPPSYYFRFNPDNTWVESLAPDTLSLPGITGNFTRTSDSSFTLSYQQTPNINTPCKILSLDNNRFVFSHQRAAVFNGVDSGTLVYVFDLKR
jgi:hypothetical protein